jgi:uncharacterized repeat protein (TIGR04138 family)
VESPLDAILAKDPRYRPEAYAFVHDALGHTWTLFGERRHVTGQELCAGAKDLALRNYGPMAKAVLNSWGIKATDDFGAVVYNLIAAGLLSKTEEDRLEDFQAVYDFDDAFVREYRIHARADD